MKTLHLTTIIVSLFFISFLANSAYATCAFVGPNGTQVCVGPPELHMTIGLDSNRYATNDTVTVSGHVDQVLLDQDSGKIQVEVDNPNGTLYKSDQVIVNQNGTYSYPFEITGPLGISGQYNVNIRPTSSENVGVGFMYESSPYSMTMGNKSFSFVYKIDGGKINSITVNPHEKSLTVFTSQVRSLTLELPRELIDSIDDKNNDIPFLVFTNYTKTGFTDISNSNTRILSIDIPPIYAGNNILLRENAAVKIIGTVIVSQVDSNLIPYTIQPPLVQQREGIPIKDIECRDGFELVIKSDGKTPACVKISSVEPLVIRGWTFTNDLPLDIVCTHDDCTNMLEKIGYTCDNNFCYITNSANVVKVVIPKVSNQNNYMPAKITVVIGTNSTVQWYNQDNTVHSVSSDWKKFDSGFISPNHLWTHVFDRPGVYGYHDESSYFHGQVIVLPN